MFVSKLTDGPLDPYLLVRDLPLEPRKIAKRILNECHDRLLGTSTKQHASEVKKVLQALPSSRNTKPALKGLQLMEVAKVKGQKTISPKTINSHIQIFKMFFDWAETHGHTMLRS